MRIRQIKPSWWLDKPLRALTPETREFYIGLWMLADDAGWLVWSTERIAAELYPYATVSRRERNVAIYGYRLEAVEPDSPHLVRYSCGHAQVPKMPGHQRIAGKQSFVVKEKHLLCRNATVGEPKIATDSPGRVGKEVGKGTERNGTSREATPPDGGLAESEFRSRVPRPLIVVGRPAKE